jgi:hypothetical protein
MWLGAGESLRLHTVFVNAADRNVRSTLLQAFYEVEVG